jgi:hypothetical protein
MPKGYPKAKAQPASPSNSKSISKMEAMRQIFKQYGYDIKPLEIQAHLKEKFGIAMSTTVISSYKTTITSKKRGRRGKKKTAPSTDTPKAAPVARAAGITVDDIRAVKELAHRIGADKLRELAEVLAK